MWSQVTNVFSTAKLNSCDYGKCEPGQTAKLHMFVQVFRLMKWLLLNSQSFWGFVLHSKSIFWCFSEKCNCFHFHRECGSCICCNNCQPADVSVTHESYSLNSKLSSTPYKPCPLFHWSYCSKFPETLHITCTIHSIFFFLHARKIQSSPHEPLIVHKSVSNRLLQTTI